MLARSDLLYNNNIITKAALVSCTSTTPIIATPCFEDKVLIYLFAERDGVFQCLKTTRNVKIVSIFVG